MSHNFAEASHAPETKVRKSGARERHNVTSVACVSCALLSRFDVPECTSHVTAACDNLV